MTDPAGPDGYMLVFAEDFTGGVVNAGHLRGSLSSAGLMSSSNVMPPPSSRRFRGSPAALYSHGGEGQTLPPTHSDQGT